MRCRASLGPRPRAAPVVGPFVLSPPSRLPSLRFARLLRRPLGSCRFFRLPGRPSPSLSWHPSASIATPSALATAQRVAPSLSLRIAPPLSVLPVAPRVSGGGRAAVAVAARRRGGVMCLPASAPFLVSHLSPACSSGHCCCFCYSTISNRSLCFIASGACYENTGGEVTQPL
jgi:hypothetical protein